MISCSRCGLDKDETEFHRNASRASGLDSQCRACAAERKLLRRYGISRSQYDELLEAQSGLCAICEQPPAGNQPLVVDHCHDGDQQVRGLLCSPCNAAIGLLKDDPFVITKASAYVELHKAA
ncbi:endonuclease VII domain-containing protein [Rhodococcus sp. ACS1]|uniref:endonuclease VII domain-containing protein n=1 Tax=Rhodococcus sp. ACS1 TaxID=2028570 RepID=UPI0015C8DE18